MPIKIGIYTHCFFIIIASIFVMAKEDRALLGSNPRNRPPDKQLYLSFTAGLCFDAFPAFFINQELLSGYLR
jgi:hypothetical protein